MGRTNIFFLILLSLYGQAQSTFQARTPSLCAANVLRQKTIGYYTQLPVTAHHVDKDGNMYAAYYESFTDGGCAAGYGCFFYVLVKFDPKGNELWHQRFVDANKSNALYQLFSAYINGMASDENGDLYVAGNFGNTSNGAVNFGTDTLFLSGLRYDSHSFYAKINGQTGVIEWLIYDTSSYADNGGTDIRYKDGRVYAAYFQGQNQVLALYGSNEDAVEIEGNLGVITLDTSGNILTHAFASYSDGVVFRTQWDPGTNGYITGRQQMTNPKIQLGPENKIYLVGTGHENIGFGSDTLRMGAWGYFVAILNSKQAWEKAFVSCYVTSDYLIANAQTPVFAVDEEGSVYQSVSPFEPSYVRYNYSGTPASFGFQAATMDTMERCQVWKYDATGNLKWAKHFDHKVAVSSMQVKDSSLFFAGKFEESFRVAESSVEIPATSFSDLVIANVDRASGNTKYATVMGGLLDEYPYFMEVYGNMAYVAGYADNVLSYQGQDLFEETEASFLLQYPLGDQCGLVTSLEEGVAQQAVLYYWVSSNELALRVPFRPTEMEVFDVQGRALSCATEIEASANGYQVRFLFPKETPSFCLLWVKDDNAKKYSVKLVRF